MKPVLKLLFVFVTLTTYGHATWHPYIGLGIGLSKSQNTLKANYSDTITSDSLIINMDKTKTSESLILGLQHRQASFFIAGEIFTSVHQYNIKQKGNVVFTKNPFFPYRPYTTLDFELNQKYSNGVSVLFGKNLTSNMDVFLKFDLILSKFSIKYNNSATPNFQGEENKWLYAYAPGVGAQIKLTEKIATRFDYSYRIYNEFRTKNISRETGLTAASAVVTAKVSPRIHQFTLALIYQL